MSTQAQYVAAAKAYANASRRANEAAVVYAAALADLTAKRETQAAALTELIRVAQELPADVP